MPGTIKCVLLHSGRLLTNFLSTGKRPKCSEGGSTPRCDRKCEGNTTISYNNDKHYGASSYGIGSEVSQIQKEIMTHGPVEGAFTVYADFPTYKSGTRVCKV